MNLWTQADKNGIKLLKKSWHHIRHKTTEKIYAALLIANTLSCFALLFLFEYKTYGIHMLDINTLTTFFSLSVFSHFGHLLGLLGIILLCIFSSLFIHASFSYTLIKDLQGTRVHMLDGFMYTAKHLQKLFTLSLIFLNHYIITVVDIISVSPFLTGVQHHAEGIKHESPTASKSALGNLVVPLLLFDTKHSLKEVLEDSRHILEKHFKKSEYGEASFTRLKLFLFALAGTAIIISAPFDAIDTLATAFITGFILLFIFKIIEAGLIIYQGCLYSYCTGNGSGAFSKEELATFL